MQHAALNHKVWGIAWLCPTLHLNKIYELFVGLFFVSIFASQSQMSMLRISVLNSIKGIERQYNTGETPVLVTCSDMNSYICKYMRSSVSAYKLTSEFLGANMIAPWGICSPKAAFVKIAPEHWAKVHTTHSNALSWGYIVLDGVADVNNTMLQCIEPNETTLEQLLKIALFDFWIANEDRTYNNANLLYDVNNKSLVSIDYGGIFNTSSFDFPLSQLTSTDTILYADIFRHLASVYDRTYVVKTAHSLMTYYRRVLAMCQNLQTDILNALPKEWNVANGVVEQKMLQLFDAKWTDEVWENFMESVTDNL